jgi:hypothetical protein
MIKEPNGSVGAPLLTEALPESRMILLVRDPSDVISSLLDAAREGGAGYTRAGKDGRQAWEDRQEAELFPQGEGKHVPAGRRECRAGL